MERMATVDREIHVLSGHVAAGKTTFFQLLKDLPQYQGPNVFMTNTDTVRVKYYGNRLSPPAQDNSFGHLALYNLLTDWETCAYNDWLLYRDVEEAILIDQKDKVLLDTVVRSRLLHQQRLVEMVKRVRLSIRMIETQLAAKRGMLPPDPPSRINMRVVMFYCDFKTAYSRMLARFKHKVKEKEAIPPLIDSILSFEVPIAYSFLAVNTSNESPLGTAKRNQEILNFLSGQWNPSRRVLATRAKEARKCVTASKKAARKWFIKK